LRPAILAGAWRLIMSFPPRTKAGKFRSALNLQSCRLVAAPIGDLSAGSSLLTTIYMPQEASGNALQRALPKLECDSESGRWRPFCENCRNERASVSAEGEAPDFVKSIAGKWLESSLANVCGLSLARTHQKHVISDTHDRRCFRNGLNHIRETPGARPKPECPLASTNRGLEPKLKL